jgi:protein JSN1
MNNFYPNMQSGFGYNSSSPSVEHYRNQTNPIQPPQPQINPSPILGQNSFGPPGFGNIGMGINAYGYTGMGMQGMGYGMQQEQQVNGRRGRVR